MGFSPGATVNLNQLTIKDFDKIFYDTYLRPPTEYTEFLNVNTGNANYKRVGQVGGFGALVDISEGEAVPYDMVKQGNEKTIRYTNIALAAQVTENMREDDITGIIAQIPAMMAKSMLYTCELKGIDVLNSGFVTTTRAGLDTKSLYSTTHTLVDSGTAGINNTTAASLSETALQALLDTMENTLNEKGIPIPIQPKLLVIPVALRWIAERLLLSEKRPGTMDNDVNPLKGMLRFMVSHYTTSNTAYFVVGDKSDHDLQLIFRRKLKTAAQDDFNTGSWLYKVSARLTADFFDWRGTAGNAGA